MKRLALLTVLVACGDDSDSDTGADEDGSGSVSATMTDSGSEIRFDVSGPES